MLTPGAFPVAAFGAAAFAPTVEVAATAYALGLTGALAGGEKGTAPEDEAEPEAPKAGNCDAPSAGKSSLLALAFLLPGASTGAAAFGAPPGNEGKSCSLDNTGVIAGVGA